MERWRERVREKKSVYLETRGALPSPTPTLFRSSNTYAEKQTNENALLERNDESSSELDNSWRAPMVIIQCEIAQDIMYSANT
jgi:hypothetical protein